VSALISGTGAEGLIKAGAGTLQISGGASNTYTGATAVNSGVLELAKTAGFNAVPGVLTIGDDDGTASNDVVRLLANNQIVNTSAVTVTSSGLLDLNGFSDTIATLSMKSGTASGGNVATAAGTLTLGGNVDLTVF